MAPLALVRATRARIALSQRRVRASAPPTDTTSAQEPLAQRHAFAPPLIVKITLPYVALALVLALATLYVVARMQAASVASAFGRQLGDAHLRVADSVVRTEQAQLVDVRTLARLTGLAEAVRAGDSDQITQLIVPYAVSQNIERLIVLDSRGRVLSSIKAQGAAATSYAANPALAGWPLVAAVLEHATDAQGDKYVGLVRDADEAVLYTAASIYADDGAVGALLVGTTAHTLVAQWRAATLADVTLYAADGTPLATSFGADLPPALDAAAIGPGAAHPLPAGGAGQGAQVRRTLVLGSREYSELVTPLTLRRMPTAQFVGVALSTAGQAGMLQHAEVWLLAIFAAGIGTALLLGITLSRRITRPITALVAAAESVAAGDLNQRVPVLARDEIGALSAAFNAMIHGLRERERMHDLLGRFVSPTVAQLVLSQPLDLRGESKLLSILFTDLRDFTTLAEREDPAIVIAVLNAYFQIVVEAAERYGGIVNKFGGDSTLVLFGLSDGHSDARASAQAAVRAALAIRAGMRELNLRCADRGWPHLAMGIGITTGAVLTGLIGTARRMEYTAIGDAVNLSARIQTLTRKLATDILISEATYAALGRPGDLRVVDHGLRRFKGKRQRVRVYALVGWEAGRGA